MKWSVYPAKYNRTKTVITLIFVSAFLIFVILFYGVFWGLLGFVILFFSLHSYYFPTHYEVNDDEVIIKNIFTTQKRRLKEFKRVYKGKNGILLSPFKGKTFLNQFRGVFLLLPAEHTEIEEYLTERVTTREETENDSPKRND